MMSPLSVSTFLESNETRFDLVIFDEASQVLPQDAIGAIYRGKQLIVAGDDKQLPPTTFFTRSEDDPDVADGDDDSDSQHNILDDYRSILTLFSDHMKKLTLKWHYRSRSEKLIRFPNVHFYGGKLVTFPSVLDASNDEAVRLEFVEDGVWQDRKNLPEAKRVADMIIDHLKTEPEKSLGVIAFNSSQQEAIEDELFSRQRKSSMIRDLFAKENKEPFFIKNLENVQGDERDVIFISMGYGYDGEKRFFKRFGPLSQKGGERRLNVAVTRARQEIVFVASVHSCDMDLPETVNDGPKLLRAYLDYVESGGVLSNPASASPPDNHESPFEEEVAKALRQIGFTPTFPSWMQ